MTPLTRKVAIIAAVVALLVIAYFIGNSRSHRNFVDTTGKLLILSDSIKPGVADPAGHKFIWTVNSDGSNVNRLTKGNETDTDPSWSPDGSIITFVSDRSGAPQVWQMNADGSQPEALTIGNESKSHPRFSPDGSQIAYISRGALTVLNVVTHNQDLLLPVPKQGGGGEGDSGNARDPVIDFAWCPVAGQNGTEIAAIQESNDGQQHLTLLGGNLTDPVDVVRGENISCAWSADGAKLYVSIINISGVRPPAELAGRLPPNMVFIPVPKQMPPSAIFTFTPDGSLDATKPLGILKKTAGGPQNPSVTPDGAFVAFELWPKPNCDPAKVLGVFAVSTATGELKGINVSGPVGQPAFSFDGTQFGFSAPVKKHLGQRDLFVIQFSTGRVTNLTTGHLNVNQFAWSPAGKKS